MVRGFAEKSRGGGTGSGRLGGRQVSRCDLCNCGTLVSAFNSTTVILLLLIVAFIIFMAVFYFIFLSLSS